MRFLGTIQPNDRHETQHTSQSSARLRLIDERTNSSPRAAVAFSALSAITWIIKKAGQLDARITVRHITTVHSQLVAETQNITLDAQEIE
jgi:hypothetical protein